MKRPIGKGVHDLGTVHSHPEAAHDDAEGNAEKPDVEILIDTADDDDDGQCQHGHPGR
jgi:hypothetical protein